MPFDRLAATAIAFLFLFGLWMIPAIRHRERLVPLATSFSLLIILTIAYPAVAQAFGVTVASRADAYLSWCYLAALPFATWVGLWAWRDQQDSFLITMSVLVMVSAVAILNGGWVTYLLGADTRWETVKRQLVTPIDLGKPARPDPDILHVVVDGMGRADVLEDTFGIDQEHSSQLSAAGLHTAPDAVANYPYTYQALAAMLNMQYLDGLSSPLAGSQDRRPFVQLIGESSVVRSLKGRGYQFVLIGSGADVTAEHPLADTSVNCGPTFPGLFESALLAISPLRGIGLWDYFYDAHRARIASSIDYLRRLPPGGSKPRFLLAHLLLPHPPFLFGPSGARPNPRRAFSGQDGAYYPGTADEYREGYKQQAIYALQQIADIVRHVRDVSPHGLVVIVNGDHGPGLQFDDSKITEVGIRERMTILLATSWPDGSPHPELRSPVNVYRVLFGAQFHVSLPILGDRSFVGKFSEPYALTEVRVPPPKSRPTPND